MALQGRENFTLTMTIAAQLGAKKYVVKNTLVCTTGGTKTPHW
jgi:hypothetical protein